MARDTCEYLKPNNDWQNFVVCVLLAIFHQLVFSKLLYTKSHINLSQALQRTKKTLQEPWKDLELLNHSQPSYCCSSSSRKAACQLPQTNPTDKTRELSYWMDYQQNLWPVCQATCSRGNCAMERSWIQFP